MHELICNIFYSVALWVYISNISLNHEISNITADSRLSIDL